MCLARGADLPQSSVPVAIWAPQFERQKKEPPRPFGCGGSFNEERFPLERWPAPGRKDANKYEGKAQSQLRGGEEHSRHARGPARHRAGIIRRTPEGCQDRRQIRGGYRGTARQRSMTTSPPSSLNAALKFGSPAPIVSLFKTIQST